MVEVTLPGAKVKLCEFNIGRFNFIVWCFKKFGGDSILSGGDSMIFAHNLETNLHYDMLFDMNCHWFFEFK